MSKKKRNRGSPRSGALKCGKCGARAIAEWQEIFPDGVVTGARCGACAACGVEFQGTPQFMERMHSFMNGWLAGIGQPPESVKWGSQVLDGGAFH